MAILGMLELVEEDVKTMRGLLTADITYAATSPVQEPVSRIDETWVKGTHQVQRGPRF